MEEVYLFLVKYTLVFTVVKAPMVDAQSLGLLVSSLVCRFRHNRSAKSVCQSVSLGG